MVAAGGDGTLLEVLNRAPGVPVTMLPLGNENLVARFCGLSIAMPLGCEPPTRPSVRRCATRSRWAPTPSGCSTISTSSPKR